MYVILRLLNMNIKTGKSLAKMPFFVSETTTSLPTTTLNPEANPGN